MFGGERVILTELEHASKHLKAWLGEKERREEREKRKEREKDWKEVDSEGFGEGIST